MVRSVLVVASALLLVACEAGAPDPGPGPDRPPPTATVGFTQLIPREGTRHALLRVTNTGDTELVVESVAVEWPGYAGGTPSAADPTIPAGRTLDLRLDLPGPTCEPTDEPPVAVVTTTAGTIREELGATGATYLRRLWRTQCESAFVGSRVAISYARRWQVVGDGADARALGHVVLRRRDGDDAVVVTGVDGSVLHGLRLPGATALAAGEEVARLPLEITPGNRCDEHARGQATAPFDFLMHLRVGEGRPVAHPVEVPLAAMDAATLALDRACAARN